jgi:hypothetical protein
MSEIMPKSWKKDTRQGLTSISPHACSAEIVAFPLSKVVLDAVPAAGYVRDSVDGLKARLCGMCGFFRPARMSRNNVGQLLFHLNWRRPDNCFEVFH